MEQTLNHAPLCEQLKEHVGCPEILFDRIDEYFVCEHKLI